MASAEEKIRFLTCADDYRSVFDPGMLSKETYVPYKVRYSIGDKHVGDVIKTGDSTVEESWPLHNILPPVIPNPSLKLPESVIKNLSGAQSDAVIMANRRFETFIDTEEGPKRGGILVGKVKTCLYFT